MARRLPLSALGAFISALLLVTAPALAQGSNGDRREARVTETCSQGATAMLRLRSREGNIQVEFELNRHGAHESWRVVVVHERRVAWRRDFRPRPSTASFRVRITLIDLGGPDQVTVRASGPSGITCEASATLPG
jgi:hypothetical protein